MVEKSIDLPRAGITRRLMALIYDFFLLLGITFAYGTLITLAKNLLGFDGLTPPGLFVGLLTLLGLWFFCALFYCGCWTRRGQTLGMKSWRIQVLNGDGKYLTWRESWIRCLAASLCNGCLGLGLIWCLISRKNSALQDEITNSIVVVLAKPGKTSRLGAKASSQ